MAASAAVYPKYARASVQCAEYMLMSTDEAYWHTKPIGSKSCDTGKLTGKQLGVATLAYRLGLTNLAALASLAGGAVWAGTHSANSLK